MLHMVELTVVFKRAFAYTCFYWLFLSGYYVWASRSIFGGETFPVIVRTLGALALAGVLFNLASWLTLVLVM